MATEDTQYLTNEKIQSLRDELEELKKRKIPELAKRIDDARQMGDLSENAEYHAAREEMSWAQSRLKEIQYILDHAQVVKKGSSLTVEIGSSIVVNVNGKERKFTIVGAQEADPVHGRISNESPLGQAFLGRKKGDVVNVQVPAGMQEYVIVSVE